MMLLMYLARLCWLLLFWVPCWCGVGVGGAWQRASERLLVVTSEQ